jgi:hypothetical protein
MMFADVMLLTKWGVARRSETSLRRKYAAERFFVATLLRMTLFKQPLSNYSKQPVSGTL